MPAEQTAGFVAYLPFIILLLLFYFFLYRPQKKREKEEFEMRKSVDVGDTITTIGGIVGRVVDVKDDDIIVLEVGAARTKIHFKRWAIRSKDTLEAAKASAKKAEASEPVADNK